MLTTDQKEAILRSAGVPVPDRPTGAAKASARKLDANGTGPAKHGNRAPVTPRQADGERARTIETLYVEYVARRAAKSLRDAEEARQLGALRRTDQQSRA